MASELSERILQQLEKCNELHSLDLVDIFHVDHQKVIGAIKSLQALENNTIEVEPLSTKKWELTEEGEYVIKNGSHEVAIFNAIPDEGISQSELMNSVPYAKVGFAKAIQAGWIELNKSNGKALVRKTVSAVEDTARAQLQDFKNAAENVKKEYKKRKLLQEVVVKSFRVRKGANFTTKVEKMEADLTADLLMNDGWKEKTFKSYNFDALGQTLDSGHLHPLMKVRAEFRKIFIEMGFEEMPTNNFVESSFWNFDALFVPQQHPARDDHDTFYISEPNNTLTLPTDYMEKVKKVHSKGGYGSQGYRYDWKIEEARKNVLRTHTTANSARMLYKLMQEGEFRPVKFFSIDRVFRNETLDATHLAEFHQVEGVIADYNLTLGNLIGVLYEFFSKLGITQLQFKPAYNPYTEPSMEIFCFHNGLSRWIEIGNSGVFRPELLLPMGLPRNVNVIAWGLSLERPTMIKYGLNNIRDLVGPKVDLQMVHNNPLCRLDKHSSNNAQPKKHKLDCGGNKISSLDKPNLNQRRAECVDFVILCNPNCSTRFFELFFECIHRQLALSVCVHLHSSLCPSDKTLSKLKNFCSQYRPKNVNVRSNLNVMFIWQAKRSEPCLRVNAYSEIRGIVNIARYLNRVVESMAPELLPYETCGAIYANKLDNVLDEIHRELTSCARSKAHRREGRYVMGEVMSVADILYQSMEK